MPILYTAVARGTLIVAEYAAFSGNFNAVAQDFLSKARSAAGKFTYSVDSHTFSFYSDNGFTYITVADEASGRVIPMAFLDRVREAFVSKHLERGKVSEAGGLSKTFGKELKGMMEHATQFPEELNKVAGVQKKVDEVKAVMSDNIEKVLQRGEKLDTLVDKTDNLMSEADRFMKTGRTLRRKMWWQNCKMKIIIALVVCLVAVVAFLLICFSGGKNCTKSSTSTAAAPPPPPPPPPAGRRLLARAAFDAAMAVAAGDGL